MSRIARALMVAILLVVLSPPSARADLGGFEISQFHTDLTVKPNSDLLVEERLVVDFSESRHGIYRTIPVRYTGRWGSGYSLGFHLLEVTDENGERYKAKVRNEGRYVNIRIGDPDFTVSGRVVYIIRYRVRDAVVHFADHDELYWNVTGHEWETVIESASATVRLPGELESSDIDAAGYGGSFGSRSANARIAYPKPGQVSYLGPGRLYPKKGFTIVAAWPHGYVRFPGTATRLARIAADNWVILIPLIAFLWLWRKYLRRGRDPSGSAPVMVRYDPPEGVTPAELGTLVDETVDLRDITAAVVDLAVRGHLVIRVEKKEFLLGLLHKDEITFERKRDNPDTDLLLHERLILNGIFESGDVVTASDLKEEFYEHIPAIQDALYGSLTERGYFSAKPSSVRNRYRLGGVLAAVLTAVLGIAWAHHRGMVFPLALVLPIVAGFFTLLLFVFFAPAMPRRTRTGVRLKSWALGFQEFVDRVEKDRLEADQARNAFEALLPYAMALGIASKWARKFEGIYEQASPAWYVGPYIGHGFSTAAFEQSLSSSMNDVGRNMTASPRSSSGSGGGGFSGGGGGGGGGGSW